MVAFLVRRLTWGAVVLVVVATIAFILTFVAPGEPAKSIAGPKAPSASVRAIAEALGLDRPLLDQLASYFGKLLQGDLGRSYQRRMPVGDLIFSHLLPTIQLAIAGLGLGLLIGVTLGVQSARRLGSGVDRSGRMIGSLMAAIPSFFLGYLLIYWLAFKPQRELDFELFPMPGSSWDLLDLRALFLPALTLAVVTAPFYIRLARNVMADELHRDHIRTARAKGMPERTVAWHHAFRNALPPITAQAGLDLGFLLGGVVVVEYIFSWPGIGQQAVESITSEDLPLLMGTLLLGTFFIVAANIVVDIVIAIIDPRIGLWNATDR